MQLLDPDLDAILRATSRSFYLTVKIMPSKVRPQIGIAYLLARATDTVADTGLISAAHRIEVLGQMRERIAGRSNGISLEAFFAAQTLSPERQLLERFEEIVGRIDEMEAADRHRVRHVLEILISGQELDLRRFGSSEEGRVIALEREQDLEDYTYRVAGCVGEFWTRICRAHIFPRSKLDELTFLERGIKFGKGLQLVNILRDLPRDLRSGRCYLPHQELSKLGVSPIHLLQPGATRQVQPLLNRYLVRAEDDLRSGWAYTQMVPWGSMRVRLGCAWPLLIGIKTVSRMRNRALLDPEQLIKISRKEVKEMMVKTLLFYPFPPLWRDLFDRFKIQGNSG